MTKQINTLPSDQIIESQKYVLYSFISPKKVKGITDSAFIFRGAFPTIEEAKIYAAKLQQLNNDFDIFLGEGFKWVPFDQDLEKTDDLVYKDEKLNELMSEYKKQNDEKNKLEKQRQQDLIEKTIKENKAKKVQQPDDIIKLSIKEKMEKINNSKIDNSINDIKAIDDTMKKLKDVYDDLNINSKN